MTLAQRMSLLGTETAFEVFAKAKALEAQGKDVVHLHIGAPDFPTPQNIVEAGEKALRDRLLSDLEEIRTSMNQAMLDIIAVAHSAMEGAAKPGTEYVLAGETKLMDFAELSDIETLRRLFEAFSRKRLILELMDRSIHAQGVQVFIGEESGFQILDDCSVVTSPYEVDGEVLGVLGVVGPTRMAYDRIIPIVDVTARLFGAALNQNK